MIAGLLLAAGRGERFRFGDKLLAPLRGRPVLSWSAAALAAETEALYVVVPRGTTGRAEALAGLSPHLVTSDARGGMGDSIAAGVSALSADAEAVVIALGDQPLVRPGVVRSLCERWRGGGARAVAPLYRDGRGHPVLFGRELIPELAGLRGDRGARALLDSLAADVAVIAVDDSTPLDVDTPEALAAVASGWRSGRRGQGAR